MTETVWSDERPTGFRRGMILSKNAQIVPASVEFLNFMKGDPRAAAFFDSEFYRLASEGKAGVREFLDDVLAVFHLMNDSAPPLCELALNLDEECWTFEPNYDEVSKRARLFDDDVSEYVYCPENDMLYRRVGPREFCAAW